MFNIFNGSPNIGGNQILKDLFKQTFQDDKGKTGPYKPPNGKTLSIVIKQRNPNGKGGGRIVNVIQIALQETPTMPSLLNTMNVIKEIKQKYHDHQISLIPSGKNGIQSQLFKALMNMGNVQEIAKDVKKQDIIKIFQNQVNKIIDPEKAKNQKTILQNIPFLDDALTNIVGKAVNAGVKKLKDNGMIDMYEKLKTKYQDFTKPILSKQENVQLLQAVFPTFRKKVQQINGGIAAIDNVIRAGNENAGKNNQKGSALDGIGMGDVADLADNGTGFVKNIWNYKPDSQDVTKFVKHVQKYLPDNNLAKQGFRMAVNLAEQALSGKNILKNIYQKGEFNEEKIKQFLVGAASTFLPKEIAQVIRNGKVIEKTYEKAKILKQLFKQPFSALNAAKIANLSMGIANVIVEFLPIPEQTKAVFQFASSLTSLAVILLSGSITFFPLLFAALAVLSSLMKLDMGCNKGKKNGKGDNGSGDNGSENNNGQQNSQGSGNSQGGQSQNNPNSGKSNGAPTVTKIPLPQNQPLQKGNKNDSQKQAYDKYIRNYTKQLFKGNKLMDAQEARRIEEMEQREKLNKKSQFNKRDKQLNFDRGIGEWRNNNSFLQQQGGQFPQEQKEKKKGITDKLTFQGQMMPSDMTKNQHHADKQYHNQQNQFKKIEDKSQNSTKKQTIGTDKNMKKRTAPIDFAQQLPKQTFNSKQKQDQQILSKGKYFTKQRLKEFDLNKYQKAGKYNKGKDQIVTGITKEQENQKKKNQQTLIKFKNISMNKESGKVSEYKNSQKRVLIPDSYFTENKSQQPEYIQEKANGSINKALINPNIKGSLSINTMDFFNSLQVDTTSALQLALPSQLMYLTERDYDVVFYKKFFENNLLGYQRVEESIQKQEEENRKKAGLAHLSHEELRYKILGQREQYDQYTTGGTYQIIAEGQYAVDTTKTYQFSAQFRTKHPMRIMLGLICYDAQKKIIPGYEVFKKGDYVTFKSFDRQKQIIHVEGDLSGWNSFPRNKKLQQRFLGFYIDGDTNKNPNATIICDNDPYLQAQQQSAYISVNPAQKTITLSKFGTGFVPNNLIAGKSKLANQYYQNQSPTLICADIKNIQPSQAFTDVIVQITGEGRELAKPWKNGVVKSKFWPETAFVQIVVYSNWFGNQKKIEKGQLIWRNIHFGQK